MSQQQQHPRRHRSISNSSVSGSNRGSIDDTNDESSMLHLESTESDAYLETVVPIVAFSLHQQQHPSAHRQHRHRHEQQQQPSTAQESSSSSSNGGRYGTRMEHADAREMATAAAAEVNERSSLLSQSSSTYRTIGTAAGDGDVDEEEEDDAEPANRRNSRERSKSIRRRLKWYQTPSPYWFYPSILFTSLSLGMIIAPKIDIYTSLICRSIDPHRSGVSAPAPEMDYPGGGRHRGDDGGGVVLPPPPMRNSSAMLVTNSVPISIFGEMETTVMMQALRGWSSRDEKRLDRNRSVISDSAIPEEDIDGGEGLGAGAKCDWAKQCRASAVVQKEVIRLATVLTTIMGVLSALTTGYWGSMSDRRGRKPIIALALAGTVFLDAIFLIVVHYHHIVGYQFLLLGPIVDGLLGGMSTMTAATNAYVTDSTDSGSRAKVFSALAALLFAGIALGPAMGALIIQWTGIILFPFYLALFLHIFFLVAALLVVPESLSASRQSGARLRYLADLEAMRERERKEDERSMGLSKKERYALLVRRVLGKCFFFLKPLGLLLPRKRTGEENPEDTPILESRGRRAKIGKRDWELTKVAIAAACYVTVVSIMQVKIIYAGFKFDWGITENGLYLSYIGTCRVIVLIGLLPLGIKLFRKPAPLPSRPRPDIPIASFGGEVEDNDALASKEQKEWSEEKKYLKVVHDSHFDLSLARLSVFIEIFAYLILAQNIRGSSPQFIFASGLSSFAGATSPAIQSLALALTSPLDTGRLFASLGVLTCVFAQIIGPIFFLVIYLRSITTYPELVFLAGVGLFAMCFTMLSAVRLDRRPSAGDGDDGIAKRFEEAEENGRSATGAREVHAPGRGRSTSRKISTHSLTQVR